MLSDPQIEAVYIVSPISSHFEQVVKAIKAKKHVLCEKSITSNSTEAKKIFELASTSGVKVVEGLHYRHHPAILRTKHILESGEIGKITHIYAKAFLPFYMSPRKTDNNINFNLSGGCLTSLGCYPLHVIRFLTGMEPVVLNAKASPFSHDTRVDKYIYSQLTFQHGVTGIIEAELTTSRLFFDFGVIVIGEKGEVELTNYLAPSLSHSIRVISPSGKRTEEHYGNDGTTFDYQLNAFIEDIYGKQPCAHKVDDYVKNMELIDAIYLKAKMPIRGSS